MTFFKIKTCSFSFGKYSLGGGNKIAKQWAPLNVKNVPILGLNHPRCCKRSGTIIQQLQDFSQFGIMTAMPFSAFKLDVWTFEKRNKWKVEIQYSQFIFWSTTLPGLVWPVGLQLVRWLMLANFSKRVLQITESICVMTLWIHDSILFLLLLFLLLYFLTRFYQLIIKQQEIV